MGSDPEIRGATTPLRVAFFSASPDEAQPLAVGREYNRVQEKVRAMDRRWHGSLFECPSVQWDQFPDFLLTEAPTVVHFSGHGLPDGSLMLSMEDGSPDRISPDGVAGLLEAHKGQVRVVVLNACYSDALAERLVRDVDVVIGMTRDVSDDAAILFGPTFYQYLAAGRSVADAFGAGTALLAGRFPDEKTTPRLRAREGQDASTIRFVPPWRAKGGFSKQPGPTESSFTYDLTDADWNAKVGGWRCPLVRIPNVAVGAVYSDGVELAGTDYAADPKLEAGVLRWRSEGPRPDTVTVNFVMAAPGGKAPVPLERVGGGRWEVLGKIATAAVVVLSVVVVALVLGRRQRPTISVATHVAAIASVAMARGKPLDCPPPNVCPIVEPDCPDCPSTPCVCDPTDCSTEKEATRKCKRDLEAKNRALDTALSNCNSN